LNPWIAAIRQSVSSALRTTGFLVTLTVSVRLPLLAFGRVSPAQPTLPLPASRAPLLPLLILTSLLALLVSLLASWSLSLALLVPLFAGLLTLARLFLARALSVFPRASRLPPLLSALAVLRRIIDLLLLPV
jgi:hypothetical protein